MMLLWRQGGGAISSRLKTDENQFVPADRILLTKELKAGGWVGNSQRRNEWRHMTCWSVSLTGSLSISPRY